MANGLIFDAFLRGPHLHFWIDTGLAGDIKTEDSHELT